MKEDIKKKNKLQDDIDYWTNEKLMEEMKQKECELEKRIKKLETSVEILEVLGRGYAMRNGIRIERLKSGLIIISETMYEPKAK